MDTRDNRPTATAKNPILVLTVLNSGGVDAVIYTSSGPNSWGQRITIAPWKQILSMFAPDCRVFVKTEGPAEPYDV